MELITKLKDNQHKAQISLGIDFVSPQPLLFDHIKFWSKGRGIYPDWKDVPVCLKLKLVQITKSIQIYEVLAEVD